MTKRRTGRAALLWSMLVLAACGSESNGPRVSGPVTSVTLSPAQDTLSALGATLQLSAVAQTAQGDTIPQFFLWRSSAPNIVSVNDTGLATARGNGAATITVLAFTGHTDTARLIVVQTLASISVPSTSIRGIGVSSPPINAVGRDSNDNAIPGLMFTWRSTDTNVATISADGVATARRLGTTTIRATISGVTGQAGLTVNAHYYVNAEDGDDAGSGTSASAPFRTITRALSAAAAGNSIKVFPGVYIDNSTGGGEIFPLRGPTSVILMGDVPNRGGGPTPTLIVRRPGSVTASVLLPPANAVVTGFTISDSVSGTTVYIADAGVDFRNNRIIRSQAGLYVNTVSGSITDNLITGGYFGMVLCGGANVQFEGNTVTGNQIGIYPTCAGPAVNGGSTASRANVIACNVLADLLLEREGAFSAINNLWDHVPPTDFLGMLGGGVDVVRLNPAASAVTTGAGVAPNPCP